MNEWEISVTLDFAIYSRNVSGNSLGGLITCRAFNDDQGVSCFQRIHWAEFFYMIISLFVPFLPLNSRTLRESYRFIIPTSHDFSTIGVDLIANSSMLKFSHQEDFKCADYFNVDQLLYVHSTSRTVKNLGLKSVKSRLGTRDSRLGIFYPSSSSVQSRVINPNLVEPS